MLPEMLLTDLNHSTLLQNLKKTHHLKSFPNPRVPLLLYHPQAPNLNLVPHFPQSDLAPLLTTPATCSRGISATGPDQLGLNLVMERPVLVRRAGVRLTVTSPSAGYPSRVFFRRRKDEDEQKEKMEREKEKGKLLGLDGTVITVLPPPPLQRQHWFSESKTDDPHQKPTILFTYKSESITGGEEAELRVEEHKEGGTADGGASSLSTPPKSRASLLISKSHEVSYLSLSIAPPPPSLSFS